MKFLALFLTLLAVLALVNGKPNKSSKNLNHNVIVIGKKPPSATETPAAAETPVSEASATT